MMAADTDAPSRKARIGNERRGLDSRSSPECAPSDDMFMLTEAGVAMSATPSDTEVCVGTKYSVRDYSNGT